MSIAEEVKQAVDQLPPDLGLKVLDFARTLGRVGRSERAGSRPTLMGALEHLNVSITAEEIDEARREMWGEWMEPRP